MCVCVCEGEGVSGRERVSGRESESVCFIFKNLYWFKSEIVKPSLLSTPEDTFLQNILI